EDITVPVAKSWNLIQADDPKANPRTFLIETLDYLAAEPQLDKLEKAPLTASLSNSKQDRKSLLALINNQPRTTTLSHRMGEGQGEGRTHNGKPMLIAKTSTLSSHGVVIDFTIFNSVPLPLCAISWWPAGG